MELACIVFRLLFTFGIFSGLLVSVSGNFRFRAIFGSLLLFREEFCPRQPWQVMRLSKQIMGAHPSIIQTSVIQNKLVFCELPPESTAPILHEMVKKYMIHGPCGKYNPNAPCMK